MTEKKITFGRIFWPSLWAALTVSVLGIIIWLIVIGSFFGGLSDITPSKLNLKDNTVLHITLDGPIGEKSDMNFDPSSFTMDHHPGLSEILYGLKEAKEDKKIKGILIELGNIECGYATAQEIRNAIDDFEKSGKFAVAYNSGEYISQKEFYIASSANESYGFPTSNVHFLGLGAELAFFKKTFEKLDVEMQIIRGSNNDFKSAVEPFFKESMSDSARHQIETYIKSIWTDIKTDISKDRKISVEELDIIAEDAKIQSVKDAVKYKLIDATKYKDEVLDLLAKKVGIDNSDDLELQPFEKYAKKKFYQNQAILKTDKPNIAVILAEGGVSTEGEGLTSEEICKHFKEVRNDKNIKTVVFRINSPGGSALASDEIWREVNK
jgi:protease IV